MLNARDLDTKLIHDAVDSFDVVMPVTVNVKPDLTVQYVEERV